MKNPSGVTLSDCLTRRNAVLGPRIVFRFTALLWICSSICNFPAKRQASTVSRSGFPRFQCQGWLRVAKPRLTVVANSFIHYAVEDRRYAELKLHQYNKNGNRIIERL